MGGHRRTRAQKIRSQQRRERATEQERLAALRLVQGTGQDTGLRSPAPARHPAVLRSVATRVVEASPPKVQTKPKLPTDTFFLRLARNLLFGDSSTIHLSRWSVAKEVTHWPTQFTGLNNEITTCRRYDTFSNRFDFGVYTADGQIVASRSLSENSLLHKAHMILSKVKQEFEDKNSDPDLAIMASMVSGIVAWGAGAFASISIFGVSGALSLIPGLVVGVLVAAPILYFGTKKYREARNEAIENLATQLQELKQSHHGPIQ